MTNTELISSSHFEKIHHAASVARCRLKNLIASNDVGVTFDIARYRSMLNQPKLPVALNEVLVELIFERTHALKLSKTWLHLRKASKVIDRVAERWIESPLEFCLRLWSDCLRSNDIQFFYSRSVCKEFRIIYGSEVAGAYYAIGAKLNEILDVYLQVEYPQGLSFVDNILNPLKGVASQRHIDSYLELCFSSNYFGIHVGVDDNSKCVLRPRGLSDPEFLLSRLFSIPTASIGLNQLFGGSGPMLHICDSPSLVSEMPGRVILIRGRHGVGKSIFALYLAGEVAQKGGVVWYFSTEQSVEEVLYTLKTVSLPSVSNAKIVTGAVESVRFMDERKAGEGVLLVLSLNDVNISSVWKYFEKAQDEFRNRVFEKDPYCLDLTIIDSLNGISRIKEVDLQNNVFTEYASSSVIDSESQFAIDFSTHPNLSGTDETLQFNARQEIRGLDTQELVNADASALKVMGHSRGNSSPLEGVLSGRSDLKHGLESCTQKGLNVLLLEESNPQAPENDYRVVRNLADCVIDLSVEQPSAPNSHGYARRYLEILKSRFQRDQRGRHSFSIVANQGLSVTPSPAAVRARVGARRLESKEHPDGFGLVSLDKVLGGGGFRSGELNVILGTPGTYKTEFTAAFLTGHRRTQPMLEGTRRVGLFVTMRVRPDEYRKQLKAVYDFGQGETFEDCIKFCRLPVGFVTPGEILKAIENSFDEARNRGQAITRIVLDEIGDWPSFSPFIQDDATFEPILIDFFLRHSVLVLATLSNAESGAPNRIQRFFVDNASRLIELQHFVHSGRQRALLRVIQTPLMNHKRDAFEVRMNEFGKMQIDSRPSLFEVSDSQVGTTAGIQLYLQTESLQQQHYNKRIKNQLRAMLTSNVEVENPEHLQVVGGFSGLGLSVLNKLQLMQIDGYRLGVMGESCTVPKLQPLDIFESDNEHVTPSASLREVLRNQYLERLQDRMFSKQDLVAVPYYDNLSFLVVNESKLAETKTGLTPDDITWEAVADLTQARFQDNSFSIKDPPFFDFPQGSTENFNTLFLEILFTQNGCHLQAGSPEEFHDIFSSEGGRTAIRLFYRLCRPSYLYHINWLREFDLIKKSEVSVYSNEELGPSRFYVCTNATVWRHWFTTYSQMMSYGGIRMLDGISPSLVDNPDEVCLRPLPGHCTTTGEWYLCIPKHCAVPGAGSSIIELLVNDQADRERFDLGVGLPVHTRAYSTQRRLRKRLRERSIMPSVHSSELTVDFFYELQKKNKIERHKFRGYTEYSTFLSSWLQRLLRLPSIDSRTSMSAFINDFNGHMRGLRLKDTHFGTLIKT